MAIRWWHKWRDRAQGAIGTVIPRPGGDPGGGPARGTVVECIQGPFTGIHKNSALWNKVTISLRRSDASSDTAPTVVECYLKTRAWLDLDVGLDVPIRVDPSSGVILNLDCPAYEDERDVRPARGPGFVLDAEPAEESMSPIEGVTFDLWVATQAAIAQHAVAPAEYDAFTSARGIPTGRWAAINAAWQQRIQTDWKLGAKFGAAYQAAMLGQPPGTG